jgi:hypothetical protein
VVQAWAGDPTSNTVLAKVEVSIVTGIAVPMFIRDIAVANIA